MTGSAPTPTDFMPTMPFGTIDFAGIPLGDRKSMLNANAMLVRINGEISTPVEACQSVCSSCNCLMNLSNISKIVPGMPKQVYCSTCASGT